MRTLIIMAMICAGMVPGPAIAQAPESQSPGSNEAQNKEPSADEAAVVANENKVTGEDQEGANAETSDDPQFTGDSRIKLLMYDESDVYTITTRYGYQTNIVFAPQEEIELISVGDRSMWQIIPSGNRMFIRPMDEDVITNMTVLTNKRSYQFDLKSVPADKTTGNIYVAKFVYGGHKKEMPMFGAPSYSAAMTPPSMLPGAMPPALPGTMMPPPVVQPPPLPANSPFGVGPSVPGLPSSGVQAAPPASQPVAQQVMQPPGVWQPAYDGAMAVSPAPAMASAMAPAPQPVYPNYSYTYAGPDDLAPLQVYDDGRQTYLKYKEMQKPLPNIYVVDPTGKESPVKFNIKGDFVVVDAVAGEMTLKNGANTVHIYNEMLNPG